MFMLAKSTESFVQIFINLCLSQVKEQLTENLIYSIFNPQSFICDGHLYSIVHNRSVILDESLPEYDVIGSNPAERFN